ncbi:MAG: hypothetical protein GX945_13760 [Lentisphaerae bacterium]|nr:hypothetical protein [Lentisphaerota bacterium]
MILDDGKGNKWIEYLERETDRMYCRYVMSDTPDDILEVLVDQDTDSRCLHGPCFNFSRVPAERYIPIRDRQMKERGLTKERLGYDD